MSELCERSWETPRLLVSTGEDLGYVERQSENGKIRACIMLGSRSAGILTIELLFLRQIGRAHV